MPDARSAEGKSEGQRLLEELLEARNLLRRTMIKFDQVKQQQIGLKCEASAPGPVAPEVSSQQTTFLAALRNLAGEFKAISEELDASVDHVARSF